MSERKGIPNAFLDWLNAKSSASSSPQQEEPANKEMEPKYNAREEILSDTTLKTQTAHTLTMESVRIDFPLKPYPAQLQMMSKVIKMKLDMH
ncbi:hypothetical protein G6F55_009742 [Rhizopus delemar]|nr:hypothetical protein G6F55_009742 [Rhizopus delemar]KAG1624138.1 hypothetical protein G6F45_010304 [Rhizopus arrhizus]